MRPDFLSAYVFYEPGMIVRRHGHRSNHVVFVLGGGVWLGERWCTPGTHVHVPLGAAFGPIIAGPEGVTCWELSFGEFGGWGDEPEPLRARDRRARCHAAARSPARPRRLVRRPPRRHGCGSGHSPGDRARRGHHADRRARVGRRRPRHHGHVAGAPPRLQQRVRPVRSGRHLIPPRAPRPARRPRRRRGAWFGDRWCPAGTHIELPEGAAYGPIVAGDDGMEILGLTDGPAGTWTD